LAQPPHRYQHLPAEAAITLALAIASVLRMPSDRKDAAKIMISIVLFLDCRTSCLHKLEFGRTVRRCDLLPALTGINHPLG
jgi:hypothetical protein